MSKPRNLKSKCPVRVWLLSGIAAVFALGCLMHFAYELSGELNVIGIFAPVNESVWEHLKLAYWPQLIWYAVGYAVLRKRTNLKTETWVFACAASVIACLAFVAAFYYTYTGAFGVEYIVLDILSLLFGLVIALLKAVKIYENTSPDSRNSHFALAALFVLAAAFIVFTFNPPHIPLFYDPKTGTYGI